MNRWASQPLKTSANDFLAAVRSEIPVSLIATPRADLKCGCNRRWQEVEANADFADFDQVPLTDDEGHRIEGVFVRGEGRLELREYMFMAADAPLLAFLASADQQRFRFLLVDSTVSGMATISDVQKLPVYSVLFSLVVGVELLLMDWIRKKPGAAELIQQLGAKAEVARDLSYRLYTICERRKWAQEAIAYSALVLSCNDVQRLAQEKKAAARTQGEMQL